MSLSIAKTNELLVDRQSLKITLATQQHKFEREKWLITQAPSLFASISDALKEDRYLAAQLMRKRTLASLADLFEETFGKAEKHYVQKEWIIPRGTADKDNGNVRHEKGEEEKNTSDDSETIPPT